MSKDKKNNHFQGYIITMVSEHKIFSVPSQPRFQTKYQVIKYHFRCSPTGNMRGILLFI